MNWCSVSPAWPVLPEDALAPVPTTLYMVGHPNAIVNDPAEPVGRDCEVARRSSSTRDGFAFSEARKLAVWRKGQAIRGVNPNVRRKDVCGAWIDWGKYADTTPGGTGWEIDHIHPVTAGGPDTLENLQPLHWENNRYKGDNWPRWSCRVKAV